MGGRFLAATHARVQFINGLMVALAHELAHACTGE
jgi:hypothetical protein